MSESHDPTRPGPAAYAQGAGIAGLIFAILGVVVPVVGVLFITPIAIVLGCVAMYGGQKALGIAILVVNGVNLAISPTFWLNVGAGSEIAWASSNRLMTYFDVLGTLAMVALALRKTRAT